MFIDEMLTLEKSGTFEEKDTLFFTYGSGEAITTKYMEAGRTYTVRIDYHSHDRQLDEDLLPLMDPMEDKFQGFRLGFEEASTADYPKEAAELARRVMRPLWSSVATRSGHRGVGYFDL